MNRIGIIGAMEEEVSQLKSAMADVKVKKKASMEFCEGTLHGKQVVVVRSRNWEGQCGGLHTDPGR